MWCSIDLMPKILPALLCQKTQHRNPGKTASTTREKLLAQENCSQIKNETESGLLVDYEGFGAFKLGGGAISTYTFSVLASYKVPDIPI